MRKGNFKFFWVQSCWVIAMLLMIGGGVLTLLDGEKDLASVAFPLGIAMMLSGLINMWIYHKQSHIIHGSHWLLADALSTIFLSFFPLFNQMIQAATIPFFFGVWELFSGVLKLIDSTDLREHQYRGWHRFAIVGFIEIFSGVASLLKPIDDYLGMHIVVAGILFVQGLGYLFKILIYPQMIDD